MRLERWRGIQRHLVAFHWWTALNDGTLHQSLPLRPGASSPPAAHWPLRLQQCCLERERVWEKSHIRLISLQLPVVEWLCTAVRTAQSLRRLTAPNRNCSLQQILYTESCTSSLHNPSPPHVLLENHDFKSSLFTNIPEKKSKFQFLQLSTTLSVNEEHDIILSDIIWHNVISLKGPNTQECWIFFLNAGC